MSDTTTCGHPLVGGGYCTQTVTASTVLCAAGHTPKNKAAATAADAATAATLHEQAVAASSAAAAQAEEAAADMLAEIGSVTSEWQEAVDMGSQLPATDRFGIAASTAQDLRRLKATLDDNPMSDAALSAATAGLAGSVESFLEGLSDAELDECAVANGRPHFTAAPRDKKILLLNPAIPLAAKHRYADKAMDAWTAAGNSRYGPNGYTTDPAFLAALDGYTGDGEDGEDILSVVDDLPADRLAAAAAALPAAHLSDRRHGGPTLRELVQVANDYPDVTFGGAVIGPADPPREGLRITSMVVPAARAEEGPVLDIKAKAGFAGSTDDGDLLLILGSA